MLLHVTERRTFLHTNCVFNENTFAFKQYKSVQQFSLLL